MTDLVTALRRSLKDVHGEHQPGSDGEAGKDTENADYNIDLESGVTAADPSTNEPSQDLGSCVGFPWNAEIPGVIPGLVAEQCRIPVDSTDGSETDNI